MGWLFAVSLGLQNRSRIAIFHAMCAIALGHALSVLAIIALAFLAGQYVSATWFGLAAGVSLALVGSWRLLRGRHPRWVGMRVSFKDLTWWSCLMASPWSWAYAATCLYGGRRSLVWRFIIGVL
jgi:hypothetical protein